MSYSTLRRNIIGQGASGIVYKDSDKKVAIKAFFDIQEYRVQYIVREIGTLKLLSSVPNVVNIKDVYQDDDKIHMVMPLYELTLEDWIKCYMKDGYVENVIKIVRDILAALHGCHQLNIIHRDLKLENIVIQEEPLKAVLIDFGCSRYNKTDELTEEVSTLWTRAPEIMLTPGNYGIASDMWSLGCIICHLITGRNVFPGDSERDQLHKYFRILGTPEEYQKKYINFKKADFRRCLTNIDKFPDDLYQLCERCLVIDPNDRITAEDALKLMNVRSLVIRQPILDHDINHNTIRTRVTTWIFEVIVEVKANINNAFIAIMLYDRYLSKEKIDDNNKQLLATSCVYIAILLTEKYVIPADKLAELTDGAYTSNQVKDMALTILQKLEWNIYMKIPWNGDKETLLETALLIVGVVSGGMVGIEDGEDCKEILKEILH